MIVTITDDAFYIIMIFLLIGFLPQIYMLLIFALMGLVELIDNSFKFIAQYIMPIALTLLFYYTLLNIINSNLCEMSDNFKYVY